MCGVPVPFPQKSRGNGHREDKEYDTADFQKKQVQSMTDRLPEGSGAGAQTMKPALVSAGLSLCPAE